MENLTLKPTTEKIISENYPYGFREKTTKTDYLEFSPKHGFRHCSTTINPKTGRINNPKKSTYYPVMLLGINNDGHCKSLTFDFYDNESKDKAIEFFSNDENFKLFTPEQMKFIYTFFFMQMKADTNARIVYCGSKLEDLKPLISDGIIKIAEGIKAPEKNLFKEISFDWEKIEATKIEGFNPFEVKRFQINRETNQFEQVN